MIRSRLIFLVAVAAACLISSCTAPAVHLPYTLSSAYADANFSNRRILVAMPADRNIVIDNKKDVFDDYGGANVPAESRIRRYYFPEFFNEFKTLSSGDSVYLASDYKPAIAWDSLPARSLDLKAPGDSAPAAYTVPQKAAMDSAGLGSSIAVIVQKIEFKRNNFRIEYYWDDKTRQPANLEADATVLIWDFKGDAPVFYGTLTMKTEFNFGLQRKHWDQSAQDLAKKIIVAAKCL